MGRQGGDRRGLYLARGELDGIVGSRVRRRGGAPARLYVDYCTMNRRDYLRNSHARGWVEGGILISYGAFLVPKYGESTRVRASRCIGRTFDSRFLTELHISSPSSSSRLNSTTISPNAGSTTARSYVRGPYHGNGGGNVGSAALLSRGVFPHLRSPGNQSPRRRAARTPCPTFLAPSPGTSRLR